MRQLPTMLVAVIFALQRLILNVTQRQRRDVRDVHVHDVRHLRHRRHFHCQPRLLAPRGPWVKKLKVYIIDYEVST